MVKQPRNLSHTYNDLGVLCTDCTVALWYPSTRSFEELFIPPTPCVFKSCTSTVKWFLVNPRFSNYFFSFLVCPSFIITIVIKRFKGRTIVFASVSSVCLSLCPHRRTYPNLVDLFSQKWALILKFIATTYELKARKF
jgi:hypothetical protein